MRTFISAATGAVIGFGVVPIVSDIGRTHIVFGATASERSLAYTALVTCRGVLLGWEAGRMPMAV